jgi:hypothetical protein
MWTEQLKHRRKKAEIPELKRKGRNGAKEFYMEHEWKRRRQCASVGCLPLGLMDGNLLLVLTGSGLPFDSGTRSQQ